MSCYQNTNLFTVKTIKGTQVRQTRCHQMTPFALIQNPKLWFFG